MRELSEKDCEKVLRLTDSYISDELDGAGRAEVRRHAALCRRCSERLGESLRVRRLVRRAVRREAAPESLKLAIRQAIRKV